MTEPRLTLKFIVLVPLLTVIILAAGMSSYISSSFGQQAAAEVSRYQQELSDSKTQQVYPRIKKVLVLHTLKAKRPWNVLFNRYFTEALQANDLSLANLEIENLDLLQFKDADYQGIMKRQLEHKYANSPPDIIIITFASTIEFILENDLFPDIPKIFVLPTPSGLDDVPHSVVLPFAFEFKNNIEHSLTLLPDTKSIYVVAGNGLMDRRLVSMFRDETKDLGDRVSFHYLDDLNIEELLNRLEQLPDDSFVYYLTYSLDFQGKAVITRDFSKSIGERSNRPVFSWLDLHALGIEILGGRVTTTRASATMSLDIVKRVFQGESIDSIKPDLPYVEYIYQWSELKKWHIDLGKLPPDTIIQNRPYNYFEIFKWQIMGGIFLLVAESLLVFFLLINIRKRKTAEHRLRVNQVELEAKIVEHQRAEEKYHVFVKKSSEGIWAYDLEPPLPMDLPVEDQFELLYERASISEANDTLACMLGYEKGEELMGMRLDNFQPRTNPDNVAYVKNYVREKFNVTDFETSVFGSTGEKRILLSNILGVIEDGKLVRIWGTSRDVTEQKKHEKELQQSEERYELAVAGSAAGIWDWDISSGKVYYSNRFKQLLGYGVEEPWESADDFWNKVYPDDLQTVRAAIEEHLKDGALYRIDLRLQIKSGEYRWFYARGQALWDEAGKPVRMSGSITDITERKAATEELRKSELRFRSLMEQSPLAMELLTLEGKIAQVNSAWRTLWGVNDEEAAEVMKKYNMLDDDQTRDLGVAELIKKGFAGENVVLPPIEYNAQQTAEEFNIEGLKAKHAWIQCHLNPIRNEKHEIEFIVNTYVDVSALKKKEEEAHRQQDIMARIGRTTRMGQLTGSIAHEINQPLTGILSNAQAGEIMIQNGQYDNDELADIFTDIVADAKRAGGVIHSLRELYREQQGKHQPIDLNTIVAETIKLIHSEFVKRNVNVTVKQDSSIPMLKGNKIQIQQVLVNLIMNGNQAMDGIPRGKRRLNIVTAFDEDKAKAWVEDSGPGIDPEKIDNIFEPLVTWKSGGTGMGLAISNSIVGTHGGKMWAENVSTGGARVGFLLPVLKGQEKA
jgi:PAS domain S-box-containing protein